MHSFQSLLLPMLLLLLATTGPTDALSEEDKKVLVDQHNLYRSQVFPKSTHMLKMYWDEDLAKFAEAYAQHCQWAHNPNPGYRGENLFTMTGTEINLPLGVSEWHREREFYNFSANTCRPGEMCGHYTQVVWADTNRVGCATYYCKKLHVINEANMYFLVCNYQPPGNVIGRWPYRVGPSCSQCPSGYRCVNNLCEPIRGPEEAQDLPSLVTEASSSLATEASGARKKGAPSSLATEAPFFAQDEPDELQATQVHMGHTTSRSLPSSPNTSATTNAMGRHTLTLQSSLSDEIIPEEPDSDLGIKPAIEPDIGGGIQPGMGMPNKEKPSTVKPTPLKKTTLKPNKLKPNKLKPSKVKPNKVKPSKLKPNLAPGHVWSCLLGLLLLPPLVLAGAF